MLAALRMFSLLTYTCMFLQYISDRARDLSRGQISLFPLNGDTFIVYPVGGIGRLSVKPPSYHVCKKRGKTQLRTVFKSGSIIVGLVLFKALAARLFAHKSEACLGMVSDQNLKRI